MKRSFLFLIFISFGMVACTSLQQKAQSQFEAGEYQLAINSFSKILEDEPEDQQANLIVAESYRLSNRMEKAAPYYDKVLEKEASFDNYFKKGKSLRDQGNYDGAVTAYAAAKENTQNDSLVDLADKGIADIHAIEEITNYWPHHVLENYQLLNTTGLDYAPVVNEGFIYFTSSRGSGGMYPATGQAYTKIYRARAEGVKVDVQNVQELPEFTNEQGLNQGTIAISPDGNTIIYARGNSSSKKDLPDVSLFASYFRGAAFTEPVYLAVNDDPAFWNSSPAFSPDGETLYFASNRPAGYGGTDLYKATRLANGDFGNAQNLGPEINTPGNEMFPMPVSSGALFFASDGHPGFGKLDLFVAQNKDGELEIKNLGDNINSKSDDFGIFFTNYPKEGFITSNREGGKGDDDIYFFQDQTPKPKIVNVFLNVTTKERNENGEEVIMPQTRVALYDDSNKAVGGDFTDPKAEVRFKLEVDKDFSIIASKSGYFTQSITYTTKGKTPASEELIQDITNVTLDTIIILEQLVLERAIVLENIYYDLDKAAIRPDAAEELDKLAKILRDNPNIKIELSSHTDDRASDAYNLDLSQRRAESAVEYLVSQGIDRERMIARGYGKSQLIIQNASTEEEHQKNRRTEFKVTEVEEQ